MPTDAAALFTTVETPASMDKHIVASRFDGEQQSLEPPPDLGTTALSSMRAGNSTVVHKTAPVSGDSFQIQFCHLLLLCNPCLAHATQCIEARHCSALQSSSSHTQVCLSAKCRCRLTHLSSVAGKVPSAHEQQPPNSRQARDGISNAHEGAV